MLRNPFRAFKNAGNRPARSIPWVGLDVLEPRMMLDAGSEQPAYVPGEVLVNFAYGADTQTVLSQAGLEDSTATPILPRERAIGKYATAHSLSAEAASAPGVFQQAYAEMGADEQSLYRTYKVDLPAGLEVAQAITLLSASASVVYAEPNYIIRECAWTPNDPFYTSAGTWGRGMTTSGD